VVEYNTDRPHQSLGMQCPADRVITHPVEDDLPLCTAPPPPASMLPVEAVS